MRLPDDIQRASGEVKADYITMRKRGETEKVAVMLALQHAPRIMTDDVAFAGKMENFTAEKAEAFRKQGVNPAGKTYISQLATKRNDPRALVSTRGEVKARLEELGWGTEDDSGMVNVKAKSYDGPNPLDVPYEVADDVVEQYMPHEERKDPGLKQNKKKRAERKAEIKEQLKGDV